MINNMINNKKTLNIIFVILASFCLVSCEEEVPLEPLTANTKRETVDAKKVLDEYLKNNSQDRIESFEYIDDLKLETKNIVEESEDESETKDSLNSVVENHGLYSSIVKEKDDNKLESIKNEEVKSAKEEEFNTTISEKIVEEDDRIYHGTNDIDISFWTYGMTPCEWVYVEPGIQIVSNYKPNSSKNYAVKNKVSSGLKGCFIPVFCKTDCMSEEFDGRFYCFDDYTKATPEEMLFDKSFSKLEYKGKKVKDLVMTMPNVTETENGLLKIAGNYLNIIYLTDLDKLINAEQ